MRLYEWICGVVSRFSQRNVLNLASVVQIKRSLLTCAQDFQRRNGLVVSIGAIMSVTWQSSLATISASNDGDSMVSKQTW